MMAARDETLGRRERLAGSLRFSIIKKEHRALSRGRLLGHVAPNGLQRNRIGISISAKALPRSTRRNRLRRLIREAYRRNKQKLQTGFDIVIRTRRITAPLAFSQVERDLLDIFRKGRLLK